MLIYNVKALVRIERWLSALMLDASNGDPEQISWTNYGNDLAEYSGDLTDAADGATEFINIRPAQGTRSIMIPQVNY
ncbi:hypothetical protein ABZ297_24630 [Nonomuraea sp. NPDC005983]|uniref:hypothetical protein n=1 Tax=Nonomuraea sp. NPDC005983 TaxID=3155595 RepID=UPI0033A4F8F1